LGECLTGKYGNFLKLDPHIASVLYAADRFESKAQIEKWLKEGKTVVLDRYVSANQMHQGGKIRNAKKRKEFLKWLDTMEHKVFGLPRPDLIIYLSLPVKASLKLMKSKRRDQHEKNQAHLAASQKSALKLITENAKWKKVDCSQGGHVLSKQDIHEKVYKIVRRV